MLPASDKAVFADLRRFGRDLSEVVAWIRGAITEPRTVSEAQFGPGRLLTLRTRGSAAYKGIYALLLKEGALDWRTGAAATATNYFDETMDIHHIFPKAWCDAQKIDPKFTTRSSTRPRLRRARIESLEAEHPRNTCLDCSIARE